MQDAGYFNSFWLAAKEHDVLTLLLAIKAGPDIIARTASWIVSQHLAARLERVEIANGLGFSPCTKCVTADATQIGFSKARETKNTHWLAR